jgi:hypothetical protein
MHTILIQQTNKDSEFGVDYIETSEELAMHTRKDIGLKPI